MITFLLLLISLIVGAFLIYSVIEKSPKDKYGGREISFSKIFKPILITLILIIASIVQPFVLERVDAGNVGIKVNLVGDQRGVSKFEYKTGRLIINTWFSKLYEFPTFQQHIDYPEQTVITKGGFQTKIKPTFNYSLIPGNIGDMFTNLRKPLYEIEQQWLYTAIVGSVNDVANTWTVDDIFNNREKFESAIVHEASKRTKKWFVISQLRTNIIPPDELKTAILEKTKAIQNVQVAENNKKVVIAQAETEIARARGSATARIEKARGDSAAMIISAVAEAKAMQLKQQQVTQTYVEYIKWLNASPDLPRVPSTILGNTSYLYNPK